MPNMPKIPGDEGRDDLGWAQYEYQVFKDQREWDARYEGWEFVLLAFCGFFLFGAVAALIGWVLDNFVAILVAFIGVQIIVTVVMMILMPGCYRRIVKCALLVFGFLSFCTAVLTVVYFVSGFEMLELQTWKVLFLTYILTAYTAGLFAPLAPGDWIETIEDAIKRSFRNFAYDSHPLASSPAGYFRRENFDSRYYFDETIDLSPHEPHGQDLSTPAETFGEKPMPGFERPASSAAADKHEFEEDTSFGHSTPNPKTVDFGRAPLRSGSVRREPPTVIGVELVRSRVASQQAAEAWANFISMKPSSAHPWEEAVKLYLRMRTDHGRDFIDDVLLELQAIGGRDPLVRDVVDKIFSLLSGDAPKEKKHLTKLIRQETRKPKERAGWWN